MVFIWSVNIGLFLNRLCTIWFSAPPAPSFNHQLVLPAAEGRVFKGSTLQVKVSTTMAGYSPRTLLHVSLHWRWLSEAPISLQGYHFLERSPKLIFILRQPAQSGRGHQKAWVKEAERWGPERGSYGREWPFFCRTYSHTQHRLGLSKGFFSSSGNTKIMMQGRKPHKHTWSWPVYRIHPWQMNHHGVKDSLRGSQRGHSLELSLHFCFLAKVSERGKAGNQWAFGSHPYSMSTFSVKAAQSV